MRHARLAAAVLALALAAPGTARADGDRVTVALAVAEAYWNAVPCGGDVTIALVPMDASYNAVATWTNPVSDYGDPALNVGCRIDLNPRNLTRWRKLCTVVVHEVGHLTGHPHVSDPRDVMTPVYSGPVAVCVATPDPAAAAIGSTHARSGMRVESTTSA